MKQKERPKRKTRIVQPTAHPGQQFDYNELINGPYIWASKGTVNAAK